MKNLKEIEALEGLLYGNKKSASLSIDDIISSECWGIFHTEGILDRNGVTASFLNKMKGHVIHSKTLTSCLTGKSSAILHYTTSAPDGLNIIHRISHWERDRKGRWQLTFHQVLPSRHSGV